MTPGTIRGAAHAYALAEQGYDSIITGRRREVIDEVAERIRNKFQANVLVVIVELSEAKIFHLPSLRC